MARARSRGATVHALFPFVLRLNMEGYESFARELQSVERSEIANFAMCGGGPI